MEWNADDLRAALGKKPTGFNQKRENQLLDTFRPFCSVDDVLLQRLPILRRPAVILDDVGCILGWILPGILSRARQVSEYSLNIEGIACLIHCRKRFFVRQSI